MGKRPRRAVARRRGPSEGRFKKTARFCSCAHKERACNASQFCCRTCSDLLAAGIEFPGGQTARVTPVPIPNTEVKPRWADDTARVTVWERRSPPGLNHKGVPVVVGAPFLFSRFPTWVSCRRACSSWMLSPARTRMAAVRSAFLAGNEPGIRTSTHWRRMLLAPVLAVSNGGEAHPGRTPGQEYY